jgi:hypothetical protein
MNNRFKNRIKWNKLNEDGIKKIERVFFIRFSVINGGLTDISLFS